MECEAINHPYHFVFRDFICAAARFYQLQYSGIKIVGELQITAGSDNRIIHRLVGLLDAEPICSTH